MTPIRGCSLDPDVEEVDATAQILCDEMSAAYTLDVPLVVDPRTGTNWDEMTRIKLPAATHA